VDGESAQCVPGGTRLAQLGTQLENAFANDASPERFAWRRSASKRRDELAPRLDFDAIGL
jgi:hypothetical protein